MAKSTISTLNIKVTASSEGVRRGLGKAKGELRGFKRGAVIAMKGAAVAAAAAAAAVLAIGMAAKKALTKLLAAAAGYDELIKRARALNIEVSKLEAVSLLAEFSGADATRAGQALERLSISIGDATSGSGEAAEAFRRLGLNVDDLANQSVVDSMEDIGRALSTVGTRAEQLDILSAIVGSRQAGSLINTFEAMAGGLGGISAVLEAIGANLTDIQSDNIEEMNDAIVLAKKASEAFWRQLIAELAPAITEIALASAEFMSQLIPWIPTIAKSIESVTKLALACSPLYHIIKLTLKAMKAMGLVIDNDVAGKFKAAREPVDAITDALKDTDLVLTDLKFSMDEAFDPDKLARLKDELSNLKDIEGPQFSTGTTFGGIRGTSGGASAVRQAIANRQNQLAEARKLAANQAVRDKERDRILREISAHVGATREPPITVRETTIVG